LVFWDSPGFRPGLKNYSDVTVENLLKGHIDESISEHNEKGVQINTQQRDDQKIDVLILVLNWDQLMHEPTVNDIKKLYHLTHQTDVPVLIVINKIDTIKGIDLRKIGPHFLNCNKWEKIKMLLRERAGISNQNILPCVSYCEQYPFTNGGNGFVDYLVLSVFNRAVSLANVYFRNTKITSISIRSNDHSLNKNYLVKPTTTVEQFIRSLPTQFQNYFLVTAINSSFVMCEPDTTFDYWSKKDIDKFELLSRTCTIRLFNEGKTQFREYIVTWNETFDEFGKRIGVQGPTAIGFGGVMCELNKSVYQFVLLKKENVFSLMKDNFFC